MHRSVQGHRQRLARILVGAAAVPVMLVASGCSSDSGDESGDGAKKDTSASASSSATEEAAPVVKEAAYAKLPEPCKVFSSKTLKELVPEGTKSGKEGTSDDVATRGSCSWDSLDNNGVEGSQFRWLNVSLLRFESDQTRGTGEKLAAEYYTKHAADARAVEEAKNAESKPVSGTGNEATLVTYELKKKEGTFKQQTLVTRVENVVVTVDYNGAGLAGDDSPKAADLSKAAQKAAKEAVQAVVAANEGGGNGDGGDGGASTGSSSGPSDKASDKASASASAGASVDEASGQGSDLAKG